MTSSRDTYINSLNRRDPSLRTSQFLLNPGSNLPAGQNGYGLGTASAGELIAMASKVESYKNMAETEAARCFHNIRDNHSDSVAIEGDRLAQRAVDVCNERRDLI